MKLSEKYNLQVLFPEIASQWHPVKNGTLTPEKVTPGAGKKVWWLCHKGHEWQAPILRRTGDFTGCPYCIGKKASKEYNLLVIRPEIASQWHPVKNGTLTPEKVTPGSDKKVWWLCQNGHEWQSNVWARSKNKTSEGCPYCSGRKASKEYNLSVLRPDLVSQWHPVKNATLTPDKVTPGSDKKVWWLCDKGHEWRASIWNRSKNKTSKGCPYCSGRKASKDKNLLVVNPRISNQWHPKKNGNLTPDKVTPNSSRKVWWLCDKGHEWKSSISNRNNGSGCPYCSGNKAGKEYNLLVLHPDIARQWHPKKNGNLTPDKVTPHTPRKVWWICKEGHEWQSAVLLRVKGVGCPYCSGQKASEFYNLLVLHPEIASQWHPTKNGNLTPVKVTPGSGKKVWWICEEGHEWKAAIGLRSKNVGCPYCAGRYASLQYNLLKVYPEIARQWHPTKNGKLTPDQVTPGTGKKVWWLCDKGHEWLTKVSTRSVGGCGCPKCASIIATEENNLLIDHPDIASQWHPFKNGELTPDRVVSHSTRKVWWICHKGHEWQDRIICKTQYGNACPYCHGLDAFKEYNLLALYPDIARQWHPTKNGTLTPEDVKPCSHKRIWWVCNFGHEWKTNVQSRSKGSQCPYCFGIYASGGYNLQVINPRLASQWHPTKNGNLKPTLVPPGANRKVWWKCDNGHEWQAIIAHRNKYHNMGCPYCAGKLATKEYNLSTLNPHIAIQWHPTKNGELTPDKVTPHSMRKAWWLCDKGHEWQAVIGNRSSGAGCPYCSGKKETEEYNLSTARPDVAGQWHPTKNGDLTPNNVTPHSGKKVWWMCDKGHEWQAAIGNRSSGAGCPYCSGKKVTEEYNLSITHPDVAGQWHPTKNGDLTPDKVAPYSVKKVWWMCDNGHEWQAAIGNRSSGAGCPYCSGKKVTEKYNLSTIHPDVARQWHPRKNGKITPDMVAPYSKAKVWWKCNKGHEWQAIIGNRSLGADCPYCYSNKRYRNAKR